MGTHEPQSKQTSIRNKDESLPPYFNAFDDVYWSKFISPIRDQGWCGSSWAISTASVASDRFGIHTKGKETVNLSPQQLLSCNRQQSGCSGGHLDKALNYIHNTGQA